MAGAEPGAGGQFGESGELRPVEPASGGRLSVRGGVGGISFQLEELDAGARGLEALARDLAAAELGIYRVWEELGSYQREQPVSGAEALTSVWEGQRSVAAVREELAHLAGSVRACQLEYSAAEGANMLVAQLGLDTPWLAGRQLVDFGMSGDWRPNRASTEAITGSDRLLGGTTLAALLGTRPGEMDAAARMALASGGGTSVPVLLRMLLDRVRPDLRPRPVTAVPVAGTPVTGGKAAGDTDVDTSPAGLLARAGAVEDAGPGQIEVIQTTSGGRDAFIVVIPGTQPGNMGGPNPFDEVGIGESLGYGSEYTAAAIRSALRQAGAEAGDQVVAVGYSQGGIHAMNLSQDKAFLAEYDLKYVLTAGSPVGAITPEPGVSSLHLEHRQDWVPGSEGLPNPDTRDRVTVTLNGLVRTPSGEDAGLGPGHRLTNYEAGARAVSASADPSLAASTAALAGVVGAGGAARVSRFQLVRTPGLPAPQPSPTPALTGAGKAVLPGNVLPISGGGPVSGAVGVGGGGHVSGAVRRAPGLPPAK
ncbi:MAG TPA: PE-PPE domain-containing protein [Arthrobacter sp.]|nr:PE-PPE domain-containing protein [Arthrobacter sp.]